MKNTQFLFSKAIRFIINVLMIYIILVLIIGLVDTIYSARFFLSLGQTKVHLSQAVTDILSFLVMIELFKGFIEYFKARRLKLHTMIDPAIIFIVRELIIKLYSHEKIPSGTLMGFGLLLLCMGIVRTMAVVFSPGQKLAE